MTKTTQIDAEQIETAMESAVVSARQRISEMDRCVAEAGQTAVINVVRTPTKESAHPAQGGGKP